MRHRQRLAAILTRHATATLAAGLCAAAAAAMADTPDASPRWRTCAAVEQQVSHSVMLRDTLSGDLRRQTLLGPEGVVLPTDGDACLCRYRIDPPAADKPAGRLLLEIPGQAEPAMVVVGPPRAALLPAQLLREGPPAGDPGTVVFVERKILKIERGPADGLASVCLPVEYRHHFERLLPDDEAKGFVVQSAALKAAAAASFGIVDDLGTNQIRLNSEQFAILPLRGFAVAE